MVRVHEALGASTKSWDAAIVDAVRGAKADAPDPIAVEVVKLWADIGARRSLGRYRAAVKIAYRQAIAPPAAEEEPRARPAARRSRTA